ncbi:Protein bicaudal C-like protein 1 [Bienertia sinuspersici]
MAVSHQNQPHKPPINGGASGKPAISSKTTTIADELNVASKRQRRPSVRLAEIGDQSRQMKPINRVSKTRPITNLGVFDEGKDEKSEKGDLNCDNLAIGTWKNKGFKPKRDLKRPRTNWVSKKIDDGVGFSRDFETEDSESPLKEQNPVHDSMNNQRDLQFRATHNSRAKTGDDVDNLDDDDGEQNSAKRLGGKFDGVRAWLDGLGLGRYWPAFEFHEVDEEVLPLLTLEDLKDMGIYAAGSRRKMYSAIQKLNEGFPE